MTVYQAVRDFIAGYPGLEPGRPITTNHAGRSAVWYVIRPVSNNPILSTNIIGGTKRVFPFLFQSVELTLDELERLDTIQFYESFAEWLDDQSDAEILPVLSVGKNAESIRAIDWMYLFEQVAIDKGIYQIRCEMIYNQDAT